MPLIGKRLKRKDLKTLALTMLSHKAKPVRTSRANKTRIIFWRSAKVLANSSRALANAAKMSDRRGPRRWHRDSLAFRHPPDRAGHSANRALGTRPYLRGARRAGQTRKSDCPIHPLPGRGRCLLRSQALDLSSLQ